MSVKLFLQDGTGRNSKVKNDDNAESSSDLVVDLLFTSERCVVSEAASQLMKLVHETLKVSSLKLRESHRFLFTYEQPNCFTFSSLPSVFLCFPF